MLLWRTLLHLCSATGQGSGTECPLLGWRSWTAAMHEHLGVSPPWQHSMGAEHDPQKQEFLLRMMPGIRLFTDACALSSQMAWTADTGQLERVPDDCTWLIAGFPCKAASGLNMHSGTEATAMLFGAVVVRVRDAAPENALHVCGARLTPHSCSCELARSVV